MFGNLKMRIFHSSPRPGHVFMQTSWGNGVQDWVVLFPLHFITFHYLRYIRLRYITLHQNCFALHCVSFTTLTVNIILYIIYIYIYRCVRGAWSRRDGRSGVWARGEGGGVSSTWLIKPNRGGQNKFDVKNHDSCFQSAPNSLLKQIQLQLAS